LLVFAKNKEKANKVWLNKFCTSYTQETPTTSSRKVAIFKAVIFSKNFVTK
jgi:hypothetical protein